MFLLHLQIIALLVWGVGSLDDHEYTELAGEFCLRAPNVKARTLDWEFRSSFFKFTPSSFSNQFTYVWVIGDTHRENLLDISFYNVDRKDQARNSFTFRLVVEQSRPSERSVVSLSYVNYGQLKGLVHMEPVEGKNNLSRTDAMALYGFRFHVVPQNVSIYTVVSVFEEYPYYITSPLMEGGYKKGDGRHHVEPMKDASILVGPTAGTAIFNCPGFCRHIPLRIYTQSRKGIEKLAFRYARPQSVCTFSLMVSAEVEGFSFIFSTAFKLYQIELVFYRDRVDAYVLKKGEVVQGYQQPLKEDDLPHYFLQKMPDYRRGVEKLRNKDGEDRLIRYFWFHFDIVFGKKIDIRIFPGTAYPDDDPVGSDKPFASFQFKLAMLNGKQLEHVYVNSLSPRAFERQEFAEKWKQYEQEKPYLVYALTKDRDYPCNAFKRDYDDWEDWNHMNVVKSRTYEGHYGEKLHKRMQMPMKEED